MARVTESWPTQEMLVDPWEDRRITPAGLFLLPLTWRQRMVFAWEMRADGAILRENLAPGEISQRIGADIARYAEFSRR